MKKITTVCLAFLAILFLNNNANAQAFQKGTINIDLGFGFGLYGTSQTSTNSLKADIGGVSTTIYDNSNDTSDGAISTVIPFSFEYGVSDKIGVGVGFIYNNYFIAPEDRDAISNVRSYDFGLQGYYHPLNSDFYDLSIGMGFGMSTIKWNYNSIIDFTTNTITPATSAKGTGFYYGLDIKNKFWFSEHIGAFINLGYKGYSYTAIKKDNSDLEAQINLIPSISNAKISDEFKWNLNGANIGIGLAVKF